MSAKSHSVDHAGVTWKYIRGSRREQVLLRMIQQDTALHHVVPESVDDDATLFGIIWSAVGFALGAGSVSAIWWLS